MTRLVLASAAALLLSGGLSQGWAAICELDVPDCCAAEADCADEDVCNGTEICELATGTCLAGLPAADDTPCDDADACTTLDTCQGGACVGVFPVVCDDGDPCTDDVCDPATGDCLSPPGPDGTPCEDFDACTQTDQCVSGVCAGTDPVVCNDGDPCTADACNPVSGACLTPPAPNGTPCTDENACTRSDQCQAGTCVGFDPVPCDDGFACTADACLSDTGECVFSAVDARCPDGECFDGACRTTDPGADGDGCVPLPARTGEPCSDEGVACTDDVCTNGMCVHVPVHARCSADDECAQATCTPDDDGADAAGCLFSPGQTDGAVCTEDLDPCTRDVCRAGVCNHELVASLQACAPVATPFRQALVLAAFTVEIAGTVQAAPDLSDTRRAGLESSLEATRAALVTAAAELNGADPVADTAQLRSRAAFPHLRALPKRGRVFVRLVRSAKRAGQLGPAEATLLKRNGKDLLRGLRTLKRDVRRLRKVTRVFL